MRWTGVIETPILFEMNTKSVAATGRVAQDHFSYNKNGRSDRAFELSSLPWQWQHGLLAIGKNKEPIHPLTGKPLADWPRSPTPPTEHLLRAPAVGLRTGSRTATLAIDFDGPQAWDAFEAIFGGTPGQLLPPTIGWTSGRPHRCQLAFAIEHENQPLLKGRRRKVGALELRWEGAQSVLMGHHPTTGGYKWLEGQAPWQTSLAQFPIELIELMPLGLVEPQVATFEKVQGGGLRCPLEQFITLRSKLLIANGSPEGSCNADGIALSMDLVAAENWLKRWGVGVEKTARELYARYLESCPDTINGRPFDRKAAWARFEGAVKRDPSPPTPARKLLERLDYHRRTSRATRPQEHQLPAGAPQWQEAA